MIDDVDTLYNLIAINLLKYSEIEGLLYHSNDTRTSYYQYYQNTKNSSDIIMIHCRKSVLKFDVTAEIIVCPNRNRYHLNAIITKNIYNEQAKLFATISKQPFLKFEFSRTKYDDIVTCLQRLFSTLKLLGIKDGEYKQIKTGPPF